MVNFGGQEVKDEGQTRPTLVTKIPFGEISQEPSGEFEANLAGACSVLNVHYVTTVQTQKVNVIGGHRQIWRPAGGFILDPFGSSSFSICFYAV